MFVWRISLFLSLLFLINLLTTLGLGKDSEKMFYVHLLGTIFFGLLFLVARHSQQQDIWSKKLLNFLTTNSAKIFFGGGVNYQGIFITPNTELIQYKVLVSIIFFSFELSSRVFILKHEPTRLTAGVYSVLTLLLGWWHLPWGPFGTLHTVINNLTNKNKQTVSDLLLRKKIKRTPCMRTRWLDFAFFLIALGILFRYIMISDIPRFGELEQIRGTITHLEETIVLDIPVKNIWLDSPYNEQKHSFAGGSHTKPWENLTEIHQGMSVTLWRLQQGEHDDKANIWQLKTASGTLIPYAQVATSEMKRNFEVARIGNFLMSVGLAVVILFVIKCVSFFYHRQRIQNSS